MPRVKKCAVCKKELDMTYSSLKKYCSYTCSSKGAKKLAKKRLRKTGGTNTTLKRKLWDLCKEYVRKRDKNICQKCGNYVDGMGADTSHVLGKGSYPELKFEPLNLKLLCTSCHKFWWHDNPTESGKWFEKNFPDRKKYLDSIKNKRAGLKRHDYLRLIEEYKQLINNL
jgi:5-methylcytosine-specific restriction protein A